MGSSPSKTLYFRLFHGRLSLGTSMSTLINSRRSTNEPSFCEDAIQIAHSGGVDYWLKFYAALNEEAPGPREWIEYDLSAEEGALSRTHRIREAPTAHIEEHLTDLSLAVEALEGRMGTLAEEFKGRIEGSLQAFQGKGARQAEDLEKVAQELGRRWSQQFQEQAEAATARLREELKDSGRVVEESKRELAGLVEAKLASLSQATRDEHAQQLARAFREQAKEMQVAADAQVKSIKQAGEDVITLLRGAERQRESSSLARAGVVEERLGQVSLAVEALEGRVGTLTEEFRGRIAGSLQAFQGKGARQAEDVEKVGQELGVRWSQQLEKQAEAAVERLREELKTSGRVVEESKQQLASLVESKLAFLGQTARDEYGQQLAQALQGQAQEIQAATDAEVKSIKQAAEEAMAQVRAADREATLQARAGVAEERLTAVSLAVEALQGRVGALAEDFQGRHAKHAEDLEKVGQELGGRWSQQLEKQVEAAVERLREELNHSGRVMEERTRQLTRLVEEKLASHSEVVANAPDFEAEQRWLKNQHETSRREFENHLAQHWAKRPPTSLQHGNRPWWQGNVAILGLASVVFLILIVLPLGGHHSTPPPIKLQLQAEVPSDFIDQNPTWDAKRRGQEEEVARAYWWAAVLRLQETYPFGNKLPADPPDSFQADKKLAPTGGAKALAEARDHYWEKLRAAWTHREYWVERHEENPTWTARFRQVLQ